MSEQEPKVFDAKLADLKPTEKNPRQLSKKGYEQLKKKMDKYPKFITAREVVIDEDFNILGGHQRVKVAEKRGDKTIRVKQVFGWTQEEKDNFIISDNVSEGDWDQDILANAWEESDLAEWMGDELNWKDETKEVVEDDSPAVDQSGPADSVWGGVYQLGRHRLMCGDSTDAGSVAILMDGQKADMVFTDPPYGINIVGDNGKVGAVNLAKNRVYSKVIADDTTETAKKAYSVLKTISSKIIIWGGNYFVDFLDFSDGWLIWDKRGDMNSNNFADGEMAWCSFHTPVRIYKQIWNGMIREGEHENRVHPTQKPIKMLGEILKDFTKDGEIILDVFGGSGSTLIACEQLGRKCYMMEIDPKYVDVIRKRYWKFTTGSEEGWQDGTKCIGT